MPGKAQRLRLRLFVEGVEIPCISAQVVSAPNSPVMAAIQVPPLAEGTRFLPRSLIHLFFYDFYEEENAAITRTGSALTTKPGPTTYEQVEQRQEKRSQDQNVDIAFSESDIVDFANQHYKLMFVGEFVGFAWTKSARSRSLVLQCQDLSNYWDYAYQYSNRNLFGPGYKAIFSGGSTNLFTDLLSSPGQIAKQILLTPSTRYPEMKGLLGGLIHLLEAMGGSYYTDKKYAGQNVFFSLAELRLHITQLITAYDKDPTAKRLLGGGFDSLFGRTIGNLGDQASFRKILNKLAGVIFHETYGQPCPLYTPGLDGSVSGFVRKKISSIPQLNTLAALAADVSVGIQFVLDSIAEYDTIDKPTDPRERIDFALARAQENITVVAGSQRRCHEGARKAESTKGLVAGVRSLQSTCDQAGRYFKTAASSLGMAISKLKGRKVPNSKTAAGADSVQHLQNALTELGKIINLEANVTPQKKAVPAQLKQQIFRPDVWFSAPPRCNVLFPDQYTDLNYNRSFMAEPTRLLLKTHDEFFGEDLLFDNFYFAPKALTLKKDSNKLQSILRNDVLDHELFTGILPVFEKMGEFNIFAARSGIVDGKMPKIGMAQRATNFLYFKYRFAARQMQITGRFNPYVACGFPGLVIDKYVDLETLQLHEQLKKTLPEGENIPQRIPSLLGTHFLANFTDVTHQVNQNTGYTSITCSYARQVEETVEFLGAEQEEVITKQRSGPQSVRTTTVASLYAPRLGQQGPNQGRIVGVVDVSDKYRSSDFGSAEKLPLFGGERDKRTKQLITYVPIGFSELAQFYGTDIVALAGDPNIFVRFSAYEVTETKARERKETVFLPPEEYIRPGWYGECWHPSKISEVYYQFFNTGSITEATQIQNIVGATDNASPYIATDASDVLARAATGQDVIDATREQIIALSQTKEANIQQAVGLLVLTYSVLRYAGFDSEQFIRSYTWRPIATMLDMFGSSDLSFSPDGSEVVQGFEGFHSRAFGAYEDLFALLPPELESIVGIRRGSAVSKKADTRKRKRDAVLDYVAVLKLSRGILG